MTDTGINVEELLQPIPGENPAGEPTPFAIRNILEEKRKEIDPDSFAPDDPARPTEPKWADWPGIIAVASESLQQTSKDLLVAARLTEGLTNVYGFGGLADGLALMNRLVRDCWDRLHPDISDGDLEVRAGPFNWISDANRGSRFPNTVRGVPIIHGPDGPLAWRDWRMIQEGKGGSKESFDRAVAMADHASCQQIVDLLSRCVTEFQQLSGALVEKLGNEAPPMVDLRSAIADCQTLARMILERKGPIAGEATAAESSGAGAPGGTAAAPAAVASRAEAYRRIREAADALERIEPHSPIPYLLRRAVELGNMTFPQLIAALLAGGGNLDTINKEFGIKPEETSH